MKRLTLLLALIITAALSGCAEIVQSPAETGLETDLQLPETREEVAEVPEDEDEDMDVDEVDIDGNDIDENTHTQISQDFAADFVDAYYEILSGLDEYTNEVMLYDIDEDGIPELFIGVMAMDLGHEVYTYKDGAAVLAGVIYHQGLYKIPGYDGIYTFSIVSPYGSHYSMHYVPEDGVLIESDDGIVLRKTHDVDNPFDENGEIIWTYCVNGAEVSEEEYNIAKDEYWNDDNLLFTEGYPQEEAALMFQDYVGDLIILDN